MERFARRSCRTAWTALAGTPRKRDASRCTTLSICTPRGSEANADADNREQAGDRLLDYLYRFKPIAGCLTLGFLRSATLPGSTR